MLVVLVSRTVCAATPPAATITELTPTASYTAGPFLMPNPTPTPLVGNGPTCDTAHPCDDYTLTISLPANYQATHPTHVVAITISWPTLAGTQADFDMYLYDSTGARATYSAGSNDPEIAFCSTWDEAETIRKEMCSKYERRPTD